MNQLRQTNWSPAETPEESACRQRLERPRLRSDCLPGGMNAERPCPFVACRYHLAELRETQQRGLEVLADWDDGRPTCSLDLAEEGPRPLEAIGDLFHVTRERIRQIEEIAMDRLRQSMKRHYGLEA